MLKKISKLVLIVTAFSFGSAQAQAARGVDVPQTTITQTGDVTGVIEVISTDGNRWNKVKTSNLGIPVRIELENPAGFVRGYNLSMLGGPGPKSHLLTPYHPPSYTRTYTVQSRVANYNLVIENEILDICNAMLSSGQGLGETHNLTYNAVLSLYGWFGTDSGANVPSQYRTITVPVPVKCTKNISPWVVDLRVTQPGDSCPKKTEVRTFIKFSQPATAKFRFRVDGKLSELHTMNAVNTARPKPGQPQGPTTYLVEHVKTYYLDPGEHSFSVEVRGGKKSRTITQTVYCPPFRVTEAWLNYKVQNTPVCTKNVKELATFKSTSPGEAPFAIKTQGGLIVHSGTAIFKRKGREYVARIKRNVQMGAFEQYMSSEITDPSVTASGATGSAYLKVESLEFEGDFSFIDNTGTRCTREGKALLNFSMNMQTNIHYLLDCAHGKFSGVAEAIPNNNGGYIASALVKFDIENTTQANCALKSVSPGKTKIHKLKGHEFKCISRADEPGSDDLTADPGPQTDAPDEVPGGPEGLVAEPPKCKTNERLVRGRCIPIVIDCKSGYKLVKGKCVKQPVLDDKCKANEHRVRGKCVKKPTVSILCKKGFKKVGKKCVLKPCKSGYKRVGTSCKKIIKCKKGFKKLGNKCVLKPCKSGYKRVGKSCKKIIKCQKGYKKLGNKCVLKPCKAGYKRVGKSCKKIIKCQKGFKKLGNKCVPKPCKKGKIRVNGKCIKPAG